MHSPVLHSRHGAGVAVSALPQAEHAPERAGNAAPGGGGDDRGGRCFHYDNGILERAGRNGYGKNGFHPDFYCGAVSFEKERHEPDPCDGFKRCCEAGGAGGAYDTAGIGGSISRKKGDGLYLILYKKSFKRIEKTLAILFLFHYTTKCCDMIAMKHKVAAMENT